MYRSLIAVTAATLLLLPAGAVASTLTLDDVFADGRAVAIQDVEITPTPGLFTIAGPPSSGFAVGPNIGGRVEGLSFTGSISGSAAGISDASFSVLNASALTDGSGASPLFLVGADLLDSRIDGGQVDLLLDVSPVSSAGTAFGSPVILTLDDDRITPALLQTGGDEFATTASISSVSAIPLPAPVTLLLFGFGTLGILARRRRPATRVALR